MKKLKSLPKLLRLAETAVNKFIRQRDSEDGWFTCINCGLTKRVDVMQAGHLIPVNKSSFLRFNLDNIHGECQGCNGYDDAKVSYTINLIKKIGHDKVECLTQNKRAGYKWSRAELEEIILLYQIKD